MTVHRVEGTDEVVMCDHVGSLEEFEAAEVFGVRCTVCESVNVVSKHARMWPTLGVTYTTRDDVRAKAVT